MDPADRMRRQLTFLGWVFRACADSQCGSGKVSARSRQDAKYSNVRATCSVKAISAFIADREMFLADIQ